MERGLLAEFDGPEALLRGAEALRALGCRRLHAFSPYPVEGLTEVLAIRRSRVPVFGLLGALLGGAAGYAVQWFCTAVDYPLNVGGRPLHSAPAFIPITFESAVLGASLATVAALFYFAGLPRYVHPLFELEGFERASVDRFFLGVEAGDPALIASRAEAALAAAGALRVRTVGGDA
jgi:hypothetical protein